MASDEELRRIVERHFRVYDVSQERHRGEIVAHRFCLMFPAAEFDARFAALRKEATVALPEHVLFIRSEGGEDVLYVTKRPPVNRSRLRIHVTLFILTILTTMTAGSLFWQLYRNPGDALPLSVLVHPSNLLGGFLTFTLPLMLILGIHEAAHYVAARRHGLRATLPFFIPLPPLPPVPFGTLGAFISLKDPLPDRKALFDVGASGPIAGFLVAVPVVVLGIFLTGAGAVAIPDAGSPEVFAPDAVVERIATDAYLVEWGRVEAAYVTFEVKAPNETFTYRVTASLTFDNGTVLTNEASYALAAGSSERRTIHVPEPAMVELTVNWDDALVEFGDPLLVRILSWTGIQGGAYLTHPVYFAGWVGLLVTGINLLPVSQLDGGHVARAVFGDKMRYAAGAALGLLLFLAFRFQAWLLMALFIFFMGIQHPPPLNDRTRLDRKRQVVAVVVLIVFVLSFVHRPFIL